MMNPSEVVVSGIIRTLYTVFTVCQKCLFN